MPQGDSIDLKSHEVTSQLNKVEDGGREEEDIQENIVNVRRQGELSPRHVNQLNKWKKANKVRHTRTTRSNSAKPSSVK